MQSPVDQAPIEPGILPVCNALNAVDGIRTVWSCEGHPWRIVPSTPFVMFTAPKDLAFRVHKVLLPAYGSGNLIFNWEVSARFQDEGGFIYVLQLNDGYVQNKVGSLNLRQA